MRKSSVVEPKSPGGVSKALNAAWIRPFLFLIFIVIAWDLAIRLFRIPPYQIPAPADVVVVLWQDWPELMRQVWPTTYATICGFLLSAMFGIPVAMLIAGSKTVESYVYPLLVFSQSVPKIAIAPLFVVWFGFGIIPKGIAAFLFARLDLPGAGARSQDHADGRAVRRARSNDARAPERRTDAAPAGDRQDRPLDHPLDSGSGVPRRSRACHDRAAWRGRRDLRRAAAAPAID